MWSKNVCGRFPRKHAVIRFGSALIEADLVPHVFGDFVEVEGITGPGRFALVIREQHTRVTQTPGQEQEERFSEAVAG